ncbi:MAG: hypothetical protein R2736_17755 [Solirubrobacterales bacterium]
MLGSVAEAEDIVQEAFVRYQGALVDRPDRFESPRAFCLAVTTRAGHRPPALGTGAPGAVRRGAVPGAAADRRDRGRRRALCGGGGLAVDGVPARARAAHSVERAVFLLHDVFDYGYGEVARTIGRARATAGSSPAAPAVMSRTRSRASRRPGGSGKRSPRASSTRSATATWRAWSSCSPRTWSSTATAAARRQRWCGRSSGATVMRLLLGLGGAWRDLGVTVRRSRSTGSRARCPSIAPAG